MRYATLTLHPAIDRVVEVERLAPGGLFEGRLLLAAPAGKGINTARSLKSLLGPKGQVHAAAWLGEGEQAFFAERLRQAGIAFSPCPRAAATRCCVTLLERASGRETHVKEIMPPPGRSEEAALLRFSGELPAAGRCVAVCGSAPPGTRKRTLAGVLERLRARARWLIADTNGPFLEAAGRAGLDGLKGNAAEIGGWLGLGEPFRPEKRAHRLALGARLSRAKHGSEKSRAGASVSACRAKGKTRPPRKTARGRGPGAVLVTLGAEGAFLALPEGGWLARPPRLPSKAAKSATGCGDAASAGWMWALGEDCEAPETLRRAVACGSAKLLSADPGGLDGKQARRFLRAVRVRRLE